MGVREQRGGVSIHRSIVADAPSGPVALHAGASVCRHDFRKDYMQLVNLRVRFPHIPIMALTATATPQVILDVIKNLKMASVHVRDVLKCGMSGILPRSLAYFPPGYSGADPYSGAAAAGAAASGAGGGAKAGGIRSFAVPVPTSDSGSASSSLVAAAGAPVTVSRVFQQSFNRKNLSYEVRAKSNAIKSVTDYIRCVERCTLQGHGFVVHAWLRQSPARLCLTLPP